MARQPNRNSALPDAAHPQVSDPLIQRAFDTLATPLIAVIQFLTPFRQPEKWQPLRYQTGWSDSAFGFRTGAVRKDAMGFVHLRGVPIRAVGAGVVICNLPARYRPSASVLCATCSSAAFTRLDIGANGNVTVISGSPVGEVANLDGISFDTES